MQRTGFGDIYANQGLKPTSTALRTGGLAQALLPNLNVRFATKGFDNKAFWIHR